MAPDGALWWTVAQLVVAAVLAVVFHRLRDRRLLSEHAHLVFPRALAVGYVACTTATWAANVWALVLLGRGSVQVGEVSPAGGVEVVIIGVLAMTCFCVAFVVWHRLREVDAELHGPVADLGRFLRVGMGTAVPAALRSLRPPRRGRDQVAGSRSG
ncbi:hypothetical protein [Klenkia brasiliensis]|uniref:hypothetical protein n=1 Tax=Klenkia brasiliensis TaxID=333142 RepID=UPI001041E1E4|nr:hypothetical protein [Klenkia brasiliensis]